MDVFCPKMEKCFGAYEDQIPLCEPLELCDDGEYEYLLDNGVSMAEILLIKVALEAFQPHRTFECPFCGVEKTFFQEHPGNC